MKISVFMAFITIAVFILSGCDESHNNSIVFADDEFLSYMTDDHVNVVPLNELNLPFSSYEDFLSMTTPQNEWLIHYYEYQNYRHDFFDEAVFEHIWTTGYKGYVLVSDLRCDSKGSFLNPLLRIYSILKDGQLIVVLGYSYENREQTNEESNN
jgi:hypothetical protein